MSFWLLLTMVCGDVFEPRLAVIRPAPDFALTDQDNKPAALRDQRGKVLLVGFVFTTCSGTCPATTHRMARVFHELEKKGDFKGKVQFLSVTIDPERDRPEVLRNYRKLYDIEGPAWSFLTGTEAQINKVLPEWDMWAKRTSSGQLDHPSRVFLIDTKGDIREIYNLEFLRPAWVLEDISDLVKEGSAARPKR